jgi:hypothetical protein
MADVQGAVPNCLRMAFHDAVSGADHRPSPIARPCDARIMQAPGAQTGVPGGGESSPPAPFPCLAYPGGCCAQGSYSTAADDGG